MSKFRAGIVGISGYGGGEALRLLAGHPQFELVYAAGEGSAGTRVGDRYPGSSKFGEIVIDKFDPTRLPAIDILFASLPTGASELPLAQVPASCRIVDIGGDHRYVPGWTYGLADVWPDEIRGKTRVANPGCYPAATLTALAPLLSNRLIDPTNIIVDAKSGVSGAGRGGGASAFGYAETNEDLAAYGLLKHPHMPEIAATIGKLAGTPADGLVFTPHLIPMTRGILTTIYARGTATTQQCLDAATEFYKGRAFVRITDKPPHTKWASGSNFAFVHYSCDPTRNLVIALCAIDNLGKGAAGQAVQNANLMFGLPENTGLDGLGLYP